MDPDRWERHTCFEHYEKGEPVLTDKLLFFFLRRPAVRAAALGQEVVWVEIDGVSWPVWFRHLLLSLYCLAPNKQGANHDSQHSCSAIILLRKLGLVLLTSIKI